MATTTPVTIEQREAYMQFGILLIHVAHKAKALTALFGGGTAAVTIEGRDAEVLFNNLSNQIIEAAVRK